MLFFFFFSSRRRHTRFKCDWSSDVCSSDLPRWRAQVSSTFWRAPSGLTPAQNEKLERPAEQLAGRFLYLAQSQYRNTVNRRLEFFLSPSKVRMKKRSYSV